MQRFIPGTRVPGFSAKTLNRFRDAALAHEANRGGSAGVDSGTDPSQLVVTGLVPAGVNNAFRGGVLAIEGHLFTSATDRQLSLEPIVLKLAEATEDDERPKAVLLEKGTGGDLLRIAVPSMAWIDVDIKDLADKTCDFGVEANIGYLESGRGTHWIVHRALDNVPELDLPSGYEDRLGKQECLVLLEKGGGGEATGDSSTQLAVMLTGAGESIRAGSVEEGTLVLTAGTGRAFPLANGLGTFEIEEGRRVAHVDGISSGVLVVDDPSNAATWLANAPAVFVPEVKPNNSNYFGTTEDETELIGERYFEVQSVVKNGTQYTITLDDSGYSLRADADDLRDIKAWILPVEPLEVVWPLEYGGIASGDIVELTTISGVKVARPVNYFDAMLRQNGIDLTAEQFYKQSTGDPKWQTPPSPTAPTCDSEEDVVTGVTCTNGEIVETTKSFCVVDGLATIKE